MKNIKYINKEIYSPLLYSINEEADFMKIGKKDMTLITGNSFVTNIAICQKKNFIFNNSPIVVCDNVVDFGNIGSIMRNCYAFGFKNLILISEEDLIWNHKVYEASCGCFFNLQIKSMNYQNFLEFIIINKYNLITTNLDGENLYNTKLIQQNSMIIFGNETNGVRQEIKDISNYHIKIPINFDSINVSVANGIVLSYLSTLILTT